MTPTRTGAISTLNSDKNMTYEHVYGDGADAIVLASLNSTAKNCGGTTSVTGQASVYGTHFWDAFVSDTVGRITLPMNEPTTETAAYVTTVAGTPKFTSAGGLVLAAVNDEIIFEQHYFALGFTAFTNTAPVVTGTNATYVSGPDWGNHDIYFQYDKGTGWNGTWLDLTATNLNGVGVIDPAIGAKLKYRIVCDTASTTNLISYIRVQTTSTLAAQTDNLYLLDTINVTVTVKDALTLAAVQNARVRITTDTGGYVVLEGITNASGVVTGSTSYTSQAVSGKVRRATVADGTLYKAGNIVATLGTTDYSTTILLTPD